MGTFQTPEGPPLQQAASLMLAVLKTTRATCFDDLAADPSLLAGVTIDLDQLELINTHSGALRLLKTDGAAAVTMAVCSACGGFTLVAGQASVPTTCLVKLGCPGKPARASAATKTKPPAKASTAPAPVLDEPDDEMPGDAGEEPAARLDLHVHVHVA